MARRTMFVAVLSLVLSVQLCLCSTESSSTLATVISSIDDIATTNYTETATLASIFEQASTLAAPSNVTSQKPFYSTGNELWDSLIRDCLKKPTFSCIQKNVYHYLDTTLKLNDVNVTSRLQLTRNQLEWEPEPVVHSADEENEVDFEGRSAAPIEEITNALYDKSVKFLVTHNYDVKLPEIMFDGARFRIQPRAVEGNGIIAKLEYVPKSEIAEARSTDVDGRLFFKKKIKKFFKNKVVLGILAVILVIKIIKIKIFWLLPVLVGAGTAKKLVLKFLLFLFPALSHVFKLCGYYHANHNTKNYHHHKHHINHLHTVLVDEHGHGHDEHHGIKQYISHHPPKGHVSEYLHGQKPVYGPPPPSGPPKAQYGPPQQSYGPPHATYGIPHQNYGVPASAYGAPSANHRISGSASQNVPQYVNAPADSNLIKAQRQEALRIQKEQQIVKQQQQILNAQPFVADIEPFTPKSIDPYYSPILNKVDSIFNQLGLHDEPCRERLVCNMYQSPNKYSPHSNYISAELSRDSAELERPAQSNVAVVRFYKYVQAARDGQEQGDCISLYPCNLPVKK